MAVGRAGKARDYRKVRDWYCKTSTVVSCILFSPLLYHVPRASCRPEARLLTHDSVTQFALRALAKIVLLSLLHSSIIPKAPTFRDYHVLFTVGPCIPFCLLEALLKNEANIVWIISVDMDPLCRQKGLDIDVLN